MAKRERRLALVVSQEEWEMFRKTRFAGEYSSVGEMIRQAVKELSNRQRGAQDE